MIKVGTSGFSFLDWKGTVYPANISSPDMLRYYEQELGFDTLEVNYTYYRLPSARAMEGMARKTGDHFDFVVKCFRGMTHDILDDNRGLIDNRQIFRDFLEGMKPLREKGRLSCVLAQFPPQFSPRQENLDYILSCKERLPGVPLVIEFRNKAWAREETFSFLEENGLGFCCVDEPALSRLMPLIPRVTSPIGYLRFHGRNRNWFNVSVAERYNYLYNDEELKELLAPVREIEEKAEKSYLFFNNCHAGAAAINAGTMKVMLGIKEGIKKSPLDEGTLPLLSEE